jgi:hypothetical protein
MSGDSIWASLECQCCFWIAGGLVSYLTMWLLTLQLFRNSIDTQEKLKLNLHSLSASMSELLEYGRRSLKYMINGDVSRGVLIILICSWVTKDAAQPDRVEGFLRAPMAATLWLMSDHGPQLRWKGQLGANPNPPCMSTFPAGGYQRPGENPRLSAERWPTLFTWVRSENPTHELRGERSLLWRLRHQRRHPWRKLH